MRNQAVLSVILVLLLGATAFADTSYATKWKFSAKPEKGGLLPVKKSILEVCTFRDNGTFSCGPILNGTWMRDAKGKFTAGVAQSDLQRILDNLYGAGTATITSVRMSTFKLKQKLGKNGKPGKLSFSLKVRVHYNGDTHMDIKLKFKGLEL